MIRINDVEHELKKGEKLEALLSRTGSLFPFMVVSVNGEFLRRSDWPAFAPKDGDVIRTVEMIAGG